MKRIVAILDTVALYGKERANIEVYNIVKEYTGVAPIVIANRKASPAIFEALEGLPVHRITVPERKGKTLRPALMFLFTYVWGNLRLLGLLLRLRPQVLMLCGDFTFYNFFPALLFHRGKTLFRVGDCPSFKRRSTLWQYDEWVWRHFALKRITRCVFISEFIRGEMKAVGRDDRLDRVIYNYPPARRPGNGTEASRYRREAELTFGYIGQVAEGKGVHHFVECALRILEVAPGTMFYVAGSMSYFPEYSARLRDMVPERWKESIVFLGNVDDVATFFAHIDVLCVPSIRQEPLSNVINEAKLYSRPSIIYPSGGMPELINEGSDGYICERPDADALHACMLRYVGNKDLARRHGEAAHRSLKEMKMSREDFECNWHEVIDGLMA